MEYLFIEMPPFTRNCVKLGLEDDLRRLQAELLTNPLAGTVDRGTCGVRKTRMPDSARGQGKRFGARVHYLFVPERSIIYLLNVYTKDEQASLTPDQKKALCRFVLRIQAE